MDINEAKYLLNHMNWPYVTSSCDYSIRSGKICYRAIERPFRDEEVVGDIRKKVVEGREWRARARKFLRKERVPEQDPTLETNMTATQKLAARLIDEVLEAVESAHPEIDVPDGLSLLYGTDYYDLEGLCSDIVGDWLKAQACNAHDVDLDISEEALNDWLRANNYVKQE